MSATTPGVDSLLSATAKGGGSEAMLLKRLAKGFPPRQLAE
ncbi:MAG: hypothetical protein U5O69_04025 [Candidatus Competibacteraceae bacterium]|nr:hypothetical protein [Candidatus Competibacteraceae bacterium]